LIHAVVGEAMGNLLNYNGLSKRVDYECIWKQKCMRILTRKPAGNSLNRIPAALALPGALFWRLEYQMRFLFLILIGILATGASAGYLPVVGPSPLRFLVPPPPMVLVALPPQSPTCSQSP